MRALTEQDSEQGAEPKPPLASARPRRRKEERGLSAQRFSYVVIATASLAVWFGCAVGPDFRRPGAPAANSYTRQPLTTTATAEIPGGEEQRFVQNQDISHQWWTLFQSPELNTLI